MKDLPEGARVEWLNLKKNDVLYFVTLDKGDNSKDKQKDEFAKNNGIKLVRGCFAY